MTFKHFKARLQHLIEQRDLNNNRLAQAAGLSRAYIGKLVQGKQLPSEEVLHKLAPCLGTSFEELSAYVRADQLTESPGFGHLGLDKEIEQLIADNEVEYAATWDNYDDEAYLRQNLSKVGNAWREASIQLQAEREEVAQLRARIAQLEAAAPAVLDSERTGSSQPGQTLPFYGKVGAGAWPAKARREITLPADAAARGTFTAEITTNALDRVPIVTGDIIVASEELQPTDGDIVLAKVPGGTTCLRYRVFPGGALLVPDSHEAGHPLLPVGDGATPFAVITFVHRPGRALGNAAR